MRLSSWIAPLAAVALMIGFSGATLRADDAKAAVGKVTGTVTGIDNKAAANVTVNLWPAPPLKGTGAPKAAAKGAKGDKAADKKKGPEPIATTTTAADGTYTLSNIAVGDYMIEAGNRRDAVGFVRQNVSVKEGDALNVPLQLSAAKPKRAGI